MELLTPEKLKLFALGVSQTRLAKKAGVSIQFVNAVMNGRANPSPKVKRAIEALTGLKAEEFFEIRDSHDDR